MLPTKWTIGLCAAAVLIAALSPQPTLARFPAAATPGSPLLTGVSNANRAAASKTHADVSRAVCGSGLIASWSRARVLLAGTARPPCSHLGLDATPSSCHSLRNRDQPRTQAVSNISKGQSKTWRIRDAIDGIRP